MKTFDEILSAAFADADLSAADVPRIDLYMDQILTLVDEGLAGNKRSAEDKLLTKTMVNNYSKEHLIMPVKGKKYSREQVMQLLCILTLKQQLALSDIKRLVAGEGAPGGFERAYGDALALKNRLRPKLEALLREELSDASGLESRERALALALALAGAATELRRCARASWKTPRRDSVRRRRGQSPRRLLARPRPCRRIR